MNNKIVEEKTAVNRIKARRALLGLSQNDVAKNMNIQRETYIKYENNPYSITPNKLKAIAETLKCDVADFILE